MRGTDWGGAAPQGNTPDAYLTPTGFILTKSILVTVRFAPLPIFDSMAERAKQDDRPRSATAVFVALLEAIVDRAAGRLSARRSLN